MGNEQGMLLALTAIVLTVILALSAALATVLWTGHKSLEKRRDALQAFYYAETSLEYSLVADDKKPRSFSGSVEGFGDFKAVVGNKKHDRYPIMAIGVRHGVPDTIWAVVEKKKAKKKKKKKKDKHATYRLRSWREDFVN